MPTQVERSASLQVVSGSYKLVLARIVCLPLPWRMKLYQSYVYGLSKTAFDMFGGKVAETLGFSKGISKRFKNTEWELEFVLRCVPRLDKYRGILRENINTQRKKYKLKA